MDEWRRKLERRNRARAAWHRPPAPPVKIDTWVKAALVIGAIVVVAWFMNRDSVVSLHEVESALISPAATQIPDGYELYRLEDYDQAYELLAPLAERGDGEAQCRIGKILLKGLGGHAIDQIEGIKWLDLCMRDPEVEDDWEARDLTDDVINTVGWDVVGEGRHRAFQWQQADINSQNGEPGMASEFVLRDLETLGGEEAFALGSRLNDGLDMPVDYEKALRCFHRAAEFNVTDAIFNIGVAYYAGKGVKADPVVAKRWLQIAADGGFAKAASLLGVMAARGHGGEKDVDLALKYLQRAIELGDSDAQMLHEGISAGAEPR